jgi:alpha-1,2-mannosyltransferase
MKARLVVLAIVILEIAVGLTLAPLANRARLKTTDFANFYLGASIVRQGGGAQLYRRPTQDAAYQTLVGYRTNQYFVHPPFEAAALAPLTWLSLEHAFVAWMLFNIALLGCSVLLLMPCVPLVDRKPFLSLAICFGFFPALIALNLGQDSIPLLFILCAVYFLLRRGRDVAAGTVLALLAIKFQYLAILIPLLLAWRKARVLLGLAVGGILLLAVCLLVTGPRGLLEYTGFIRDFDAQGGYGGLHPALMVNARGFLSGLGFTERASAYSAAIGIALTVLVALIFIRRHKGEKSLLFALFVTVALVASPYAHFPDMTMLVLPVLLVLDYALASRTRWFLLAGVLAVLFVPWVLISVGSHHWWDSRVYWLFPVILLFGASLARELSAEGTGAYATMVIRKHQSR